MWEPSLSAAAPAGRRGKVSPPLGRAVPLGPALGGQHLTEGGPVLAARARGGPIWPSLLFGRAGEGAKWSFRLRHPMGRDRGEMGGGLRGKLSGLQRSAISEIPWVVPPIDPSDTVGGVFRNLCSPEVAAEASKRAKCPRIFGHRRSLSCCCHGHQTGRSLNKLKGVYPKNFN